MELSLSLKKNGCWPIFTSSHFWCWCCREFGMLPTYFATHLQVGSRPGLHHCSHSQLFAVIGFRNHSCWSVGPVQNCCFLSPDDDRSASHACSLLTCLCTVYHIYCMLLSTHSTLTYMWGCVWFCMLALYNCSWKFFLPSV